ncbi:MAG: PrsW family intramembrane metalloprotease [Sorangium cellulosum]|nr:MAG: PrsW family intramembrane metalloprotease [Sorangium cellulosum]
MMAWLPGALVWLALCVIPSALWLKFIWQVPPQRDPLSAVLGTSVFAIALGIGAAFVHDFILSLTGLQSDVENFGSSVGLAFVLVFSAPLAEGAKVAAAWPAFRSSHFNEEFDGILYSTAAATGFAVGQSGAVLLTNPITGHDVVRVALMVLAHPLMSPIWGYALGKVRRSRTPSGRFVISWLAVTVVHGLMLHLTQATSLLALIAAFSLLLALAFLTWWAARDLLARFGRSVRMPAHTMLPLLPTPSLSALKHAFLRAEKPILFHWIALGALTTTGVMLAMFALAVWTGHQIGLDFSAIEREDTSATTVVPLVLLTSSILAAFPISGYLITKASASDSVLEPALAAALAIVAVLIMFGLAAPVALVFALAFAPIAFGLACAGAWFGLGK